MLNFFMTFFLGLFTLLFVASHAYAEPLSVDIRNLSEPVLCAEKDNVNITLTSPRVRHFKIEAAHPAYINGLIKDNWDADWTNCDMTGDPVFQAEPRKITFYDSIEMWLVGYTFPSFWRPADTTVKVGNRIEKGLHMVQLWMLNKDKADEVLVFYPPDGYWRARPLPPSHLRSTAYGSSFLFGPLENAGRPVVNLKEVEFFPETKTFKLSFKDGTTGSLKLETLDENRLVLDAKLDQGVKSDGQAFAALRSMYITSFNNDAAQVAVRDPAAQGWREEALMSFGQGGSPVKATDFWAGRHHYSRHNTSSPDMLFRGFGDKPKDNKPSLSSPSP
jgi:hypothetical protein